MKELENMSMHELEAIALDGSVKVPEGLRGSISKDLDTLAFLAGVSPARPRRILYAAGIAASIVLFVGIGLGINGLGSRPKDTFTDPQQAYAMLQESFSLISSKMDKCVDSMAKETSAVLSKTNQIMDKIN